MTELVSIWESRPLHINLASVSTLQEHKVCFMCSLWVWKGHILNDTHYWSHREKKRKKKKRKRFTGSFSVTYAHFPLRGRLCKSMFPLSATHLFYFQLFIYQLCYLVVSMSAWFTTLGNDCQGNWLLKWWAGAQVKGSVYHIIDFLTRVPHTL